MTPANRFRHPATALVALTLLGLSACASAPESFVPLATLEEEFEAARTQEVPALAPIRFQEAERALDQARSRLGEAEEEELRHLTTLADIRLDTAVAEAQAARVVDRRRMLAGDRQRLILEEREEQLALARQQLAQFEQRETANGILVTLRDITFDLDSANLAPGDQERLRPLAEYLRQNADRDVIIEGHTDSSGPDGYNLDLSRARADAVRNFLVAQGVDAARIRTVGRGEAVPVADNATQAGRLQNRRIEVTIADPAAG